MNRGFCNRFTNLFRKNWKNLLISIVIIAEVIAISFVAVHAWVETVSSIKIINETDTNSKIDTYVFTEAMIGGKSGTIDLGKYFKPAGNMHFAPASSADGRTLYFPQANQSSGFFYRKGNVNDKNTTYLSATFKLRADTNADFFFTNSPAIEVSDDIRVSVTAYTEGENPEGTYDASTGKIISNTKIYANNASTAQVVNAANGATGDTAVEKFSDHTKGKSTTYRLFAVGANETKIVTINVWLQKKTTDNSDLTNSMSASQTIKNLGIISSLTPRHVTLIPTPTWDTAGTNEYYYAWCWRTDNDDDSSLYKLEKDGNEHYGFDYNGTYQNTLFIRSGSNNLTKEYLKAGHWNDNTIWNVTENTAIPNDPVDPTFIIETINGSSQTDTSGGTNSTAKKSTGSWHDPATVRVVYVNNQTADWGTLSATSYVGTTTGSHVIETTNSSSQKHADTVHAWPGKLLQLEATAKTNYAFVGWFDNAEGNGEALSVNATYTPNAPATASEKVYYAKFKEVRTLTIYRYLDGSNVSTSCGTISIDGMNSASGQSVSRSFDTGASVTFSASAAAGYSFDGFYTTANGNTEVSSPVTLNDSTTYYARFSKNSYYLKASWNGWSETQDKLSGSGDEITFEQELDPGQYEFKIFDGIGSEHWSNAYEYKYRYNNSTFLGGNGGDTLNNSSNTGNMKLNIGYTAKYTFHFIRSTKKFYITAVDVTTYHVAGDITGGWTTGNNNKMSRVGSTDEYVYTVYVDGKKDFKIYTNSGTTYSNGYDYHDRYFGASDGDVFNTSSGNCSMNGNKKNYVFHFNSSSKRFWITNA